MKHRHKTLFSIAKVAFSNILSLLSGVVVGFIVPKIMGVTDYGYYKTFSLYISYVGLFHFGIEDGIYLKFAGKDLSELEERKFHFYTLFLIVIEGTIGLLIAGISCIWLHGDLRYIFFFVAVYLFSINIGNHFQFISQITERFTELSIVGTARSILSMLSVLLLWLLNRYAIIAIDYKIYVICTVTISLLILFAYIIIYRKLVFGKLCPWKEGMSDIRHFLKIGFPLMIANLCSTLLLTIDRQFVNVLYDTDTYAVYAFAYNLLSLITTMTSAISVVLFPIIKRLDGDALLTNYSKLNSLLLIFVGGCLLVYFPICPFINWFLPHYTGSLVIFRIILPGLIGTSAITIIMHNYYKALGHNFRFFVLSLCILLLAIAADLAAYYIFGTTASISIASVGVIIVWYIAADIFFIRRFKTAWIRNLLFMVCCMGAFYGTTAIPNIYLAASAYLVAFLVLLAAFYYKEIGALIRRRRERAMQKSGEVTETPELLGEDQSEPADTEENGGEESEPKETSEQREERTGY